MDDVKQDMVTIQTRGWKATAEQNEWQKINTKTKIKLNRFYNAKTRKIRTATLCGIDASLHIPTIAIPNI